MNLYILRHGIAEDRDDGKYPDDRQRPLTDKGADRIRREVEGMNAIGIAPDVIITSPLVRAVQTAEIVRQGLNAPPRLTISDALVPGAHPSLMQNLTAVYPSETNLMAIGHEPQLSSIVSYILTEQTTGFIKLKKGALCNLDLSAQGDERLLWVVTPRQLIAQARSDADDGSYYDTLKESEMTDIVLAYKVRSYSTGTLGRSICNARNHHWVADDSGGEEIGAGELFLSGISACAVNMIERIASEENIPLDWMDVSVEAYRDLDAAQGERTVYDKIRIHLHIWGVSDADGDTLVDIWKRR